MRTERERRTRNDEGGPGKFSFFVVTRILPTASGHSPHSGMGGNKRARVFRMGEDVRLVYVGGSRGAGGKTKK